MHIFKRCKLLSGQLEPPHLCCCSVDWTAAVCCFGYDSFPAEYHKGGGAYKLNVLPIHYHRHFNQFSAMFSRFFICQPVPAISSNFQSFPTISSHSCYFQPFQASFSHFQPCPATSSNFRPIQPFPALSFNIRQFQPFPDISSHISNSSNFQHFWSIYSHLQPFRKVPAI